MDSSLLEPAAMNRAAVDAQPLTARLSMTAAYVRVLVEDCGLPPANGKALILALRSEPIAVLTDLEAEKALRVLKLQGE